MVKAKKEIKSNEKGSSVGQEQAFLGRDFLTWLWFRCESEGGEFDLGGRDGGGQTAVMVEDALALVSVDEDGSVMTLRKGSPTARPEAANALAAGMTLKKARVFVARGPREWQFTLDGETLDLGGLKTPEIDDKDETPKGEGEAAPEASDEEKAAGGAGGTESPHAAKKKKAKENDALDDVAEKLLQAEEARDVVEGLYKQFLGIRLAKDWDKTELPRMKDWVSMKLDKAAAEVGLK
jgi:recombination associated protein RdgC